MNMSYLLSLAFVIGLIIQGESVLTPVVQTNKGPVIGEILTTVQNDQLEFAAFKGIPYAKPPTGNLRFKPPVEKEAWTSVLNATSEGSICMQFNITDSTVIGSEDCLYLNVYTPHTQFNEWISKPVMVWIHGGAYKTGNSNTSYYGPDFLIEEDVIVVTFNYRLGPFGFLNLYHEEASGNYALKDQNLVLKWVKSNIANFGGNPNKITLFGQSAGSVFVDLHILSDMSTGLFSQTISMSGSPLCLYWGFQKPTEAEEMAFFLGSKLGTTTLIKSTLLKTLVEAPADEIIRKAQDIPLLPFRPTIESTAIAKNQEKFITHCALKKYYSGNYNKGPHMMGFVSNETVGFVENTRMLVDLAAGITMYIQLAGLNIELSYLNKIVELSKDSIFQTGNLLETEVYHLIKQTTDLLFITGIDSKQQALQLHNRYPIYYYRFSFESNYSAHEAIGINLGGIGHEDELPYIFYRPAVNLPLFKPEIELVRRKMVRLWTNFAKYGNPTPNGSVDKLLGVTWPDSRHRGWHLEIDKELTIGPRPIDISIETYESEGLGTFPILNGCTTNVFFEIVNFISDVLS